MFPGREGLPAKLGGAAPGPGAPAGRGRGQPQIQRRGASGRLLPLFFPVMAPATARLASSKAASAAQVRARPAPRAPRPAPRAPPPGTRPRGGCRPRLPPAPRPGRRRGARAGAGPPPSGPPRLKHASSCAGAGRAGGRGIPRSSALRPRGCPRGHAPRGSGLSDGVAAWAPGEGRDGARAPGRPAPTGCGRGSLRPRVSLRGGWPPSAPDCCPALWRLAPLGPGPVARGIRLGLPPPPS